MSSRTVLNNGKGGGVSILIFKKNILKVIKFLEMSREMYDLKKFSLFLGPPTYF
jgi:hypothetical protein